MLLNITGALLVIGAAVLIGLSTSNWFALREGKPKQPAGDSPSDEKADHLRARLEERVLHDKAKTKKTIAIASWILLALGLLLLYVAESRHLAGTNHSPTREVRNQDCSQGQLQTTNCCCQIALQQTSPALPERPDPRLLSPIVLVTGLAILAGATLLLFGKRSATAKTVGAVTLLGGLTGHLIHEIKIDNLFKIDGLKVEADIDARLNKLGALGPEYLGYAEGFDPGLADIKPEMLSGIEAVCEKWKTHPNGHQGLLLVVGATDRVPLSAYSRRQYESNFGLARARAEKVKEKIAHCGVPDPAMLALVSGPKNTPEGGGRSKPLTGFPEDRRVDVWALWSWPGTEPKSSRFRISAESEKEDATEK
jgi:hypothetical protein